MATERIYYLTISKYFENRGYKTLIDYPVFGPSSTRIDVLAISHNNDLISIEVKLDFSRKYIKQLLRRMIFSDFVYIALPSRYYKHMRRYNKELLSKLGIGIITFDSAESIKIEQEPRRSFLLSEVHKEYILNRIISCR